MHVIKIIHAYSYRYINVSHIPLSLESTLHILFNLKKVKKKLNVFI